MPPKSRAPKTRNDDDLHPLAETDLARSGLNLRDAEQLGMEVLSAARTQRLGHTFALPALLFQYYDPFTDDWVPLEQFHRVRYLEEPGGFASLGAQKPQRYSQPPETLNDLYIPRMVKGVPYDWRQAFSNPSTPLYFTEGEKKAACACKLGLPFLALGGVSMWSAQSRGVRELPTLTKIEMRGRTVYVVFDTDDAGGMKPEVLAAAHRFMEWLTLRGAVPSLVVLPAEGKKVGLDDYLLAHGAETFVDQVIPVNEIAFTDAQVLCQAAQRYAYVLDVDRFTTLDPGDEQVLMPAAHLDRAMGLKEVSLPRLDRVRVQGGGFVIRTAPKAVRLSDALLMWGGGERFASTVYRPGEPRVVTEGTFRLLNLWTGWRCEYGTTKALPSRAEREKALKEWFWAIDNIFADDPEARDFAEHWLHYPLKHPGAKLYTFALVCSREEGIGKSFIGHMLARYVYGLTKPGPRHAWQLSEGDLANPFNPYLHATSFVEADDISSKDKKSVYERVKSFVTSDTVQLNLKGTPQFMLENRANFWMTANDGAPFYLSGQDRRAFVHVPRKAKKDKERYDALDKLFAAGVAAPSILWWAREKYEERDFRPKQDAPATLGKREVHLNGAGTLREWASALVESAEELTRPFATPRELYALLQLEVPGAERYSVDAMGHAIKDAGCVRWNGGGLAFVKAGESGAARKERIWILDGAHPVNQMDRQQIEGALERVPFNRQRLAVETRPVKAVGAKKF